MKNDQISRGSAVNTMNDERKGLVSASVCEHGRPSPPEASIRKVTESIKSKAKSYRRPRDLTAKVSRTYWLDKYSLVGNFNVLFQIRLKVIKQKGFLVVLDLLGDFGNMLALSTGDRLFVVGHLPATVRAGDVSGTIGSPAGDLRDVTKFLGTGRNTHHGQPHMEQEGDETPQGGLVASVLGGRPGKSAAHFTR